MKVSSAFDCAIILFIRSEAKLAFDNERIYKKFESYFNGNEEELLETYGEEA